MKRILNRQNTDWRRDSEPQDKRFTINRLLELFHIDELEDEVTAAYEKRTPMTQESAEEALPQILAEMLDYAAEQMLKSGQYDYIPRFMFDTKIMRCWFQD